MGCSTCALDDGSVRLAVAPRVTRPNKSNGRYVEMLAYDLHMSGDCDNSASNGQLHFAMRVIIKLDFCGGDEQ